MALQKLGDHTLLMRGSPHTLIVMQEGKTLVIDPGHGAKRAKQLRKELSGMPGETVYLLTHNHSDHSNNACEPPAKKSLAPLIEIPPLHVTRLRTTLTFGLPLEEGELLMMTPKPTPCVEPLEQEPQGIQRMSLPGHTPGQTGYTTPDGVVYAADSLFGDQVLARYGVLYHMDTFQALDTLKNMLTQLAEKGYTIVPSHGPPVKEGEAMRLVQANIERLEDTIETVKSLLAGSPLTITRLAALMHKHYNVDPSPTSMLLFETGLRGIVARLYEEGLATPYAGTEGLQWRLERA